MKVQVISQYGYKEALYGIGLSYGLTSEIDPRDFIENPLRHIYLLNKLDAVARKLSGKGNGEDKFLQFMKVTMLIDAPRYFWSEFDTYKFAEKMSESTMHTIKKRPLVKSDFQDDDISDEMLNEVNEAIKNKVSKREIKKKLPESFLQARLVQTNYQCINNILAQRHNHELIEWKFLCTFLKWMLRDEFLINVKLPELGEFDGKRFTTLL